MNRSTRVAPEDVDERWWVAPDLAVRRHQPELMDDPALDLELHREALGALRRINRVSLASRHVWREVRALRGQTDREPTMSRAVEGEGGERGSPGEPIRILDVLLHRAGQIVSREELREAIWPADTWNPASRSSSWSSAWIRCT